MPGIQTICWGIRGVCMIQWTYVAFCYFTADNGQSSTCKSKVSFKQTLVPFLDTYHESYKKPCNRWLWTIVWAEPATKVVLNSITFNVMLHHFLSYLLWPNLHLCFIQPLCLIKLSYNCTIQLLHHASSAQRSTICCCVLSLIYSWWYVYDNMSSNWKNTSDSNSSSCCLIATLQHTQTLIHNCKYFTCRL